VRVLPYVRLERDVTTRGFMGVSTSVLPRPQWGPVFGNVLLRSSIEWQQAGPALVRLNSYALSAARPIGPATRLEAGVSWTRGGQGATLQLALSSYLPMLRSYTTVTAPAAAPAFATQYVQGSLLWDRRDGRLTGAPGPSLERSGLTGRVFLDENGNGRYDPGEPTLPRVRDSLTLESPLLVPVYAAASIVPGPNRFRTLDIPIVQAGVVEGQVVRAEQGGGVGGVTLLLTERNSGAQRTVTTFSDGGFYTLGVKPGDYQLTVAPQVLEALGVRAVPLRFTLAPGAQGVGRSGIEIRLTPTR